MQAVSILKDKGLNIPVVTVDLGHDDSVRRILTSLSSRWYPPTYPEQSCRHSARAALRVNLKVSRLTNDLSMLKWL